MEVSFNLFPSLILEAVKTETHIKSQVDRAIDDKASRMAYQEEAGDEEFHERKLMRGIYTSLDSLKIELDKNLHDGDISAYIDESNDKIEIKLNANDSFNESMTDTLARVCSKYIEDSVLVLWWGTFNANQAQFYTSLLSSDILAINRCFYKVALKKVDTPYTKSLSVDEDEYEMSIDESIDVKYTISNDATDDVEIFCPKGLLWNRSETANTFELYATKKGLYRCKLYSLHDELVKTYITVIVS